MLIIICIFAGAIAFAAAGCFSFWPVDVWYRFYRPIILLLAGFIAGIIIWWCLLFIFGLFVNQKKEYEKPNKWSRFWLIEGEATTNFLAGCSVKIKNGGLIPRNTRFLFVCNHRSNFDPMITTQYFGKYDLAFITKPNNFKIPLGHRFMKGLGYLPIDRDNPLQSLETMKKAADRIEKNYTSIAIYPEGTRHRDGSLGPFHEGVFNIAIKSKAPIVVATISGTENITKNVFKRFTRIKLDVIEVIPYSEIEGKPAKAISDYVYTLMDNHLKEIEQNVNR